MAKGLKRLEGLEPEFKEECLTLIKNLEESTGIEWIIVQGVRTIAEQNKLYAQGRTTKGPIVTKAKGGSSPHNFKQAIDIVPLKNGEPWWEAPEKYWQALGTLVEGMGNVWGGHFKSILDKPHVEDDDWREDYELWKAGKLQIG